MGYTSYNVSSRSIREEEMGYSTKGLGEIFTQTSKRTIHESMSPMGLIARECRDSEAHPNTLPIILGLDVTGSMMDIPKKLIADGLPTLMSTLIQAGVPDAALCFMAFGDHVYDKHPLQVAQFESGDEELDVFLTRTYLERGGGGNAGESYFLPWYTAAFHTVTDAWEKRKQKGFLITIGDEPTLLDLSRRTLVEIFGETAYNNPQFIWTAESLLKAAQEKYHVYHINLNEHRALSQTNWTSLLGQNAIGINDYREVPKFIANLVAEHYTQELRSNTAGKMDSVQAPDDLKITL